MVHYLESFDSNTSQIYIMELFSDAQQSPAPFHNTIKAKVISVFGIKNKTQQM